MATTQVAHRLALAHAEPRSSDVTPINTAMDVLRRLFCSLKVAADDTEAALGVTAAQLFVLREIAKGGPLTISELARRTATAQSSVSEVVSRLVARGLLTRTRAADDRRRVQVALSPSGRELLTRAPETVQERLIAAFERLSVEQQRQATAGLHAWVDEAGLSDLDPPMFFEPCP